MHKSACPNRHALKSTTMNDQFVSLATLSLSRAEILQGRLEARGIDSFIKTTDSLSPLYPEGHTVWVRQSDVAVALPIALHIKEEFALASHDFELLSTDVHQILFPTDFSTQSYNAFHYAFHIAQRLEANITLLHIYYDASISPVAAVDSYAYHVGVDVDLQAIEQQAHQAMQEFLQHFEAEYKLSQQNFEVKTQLVGGAVEDSILDTAESIQADLIVMGTQGVRRTPGDFFGSVTAHLIEEATLPVLCIPPNAQYNQHHEPLQVLYATNFEDSDYLAIRKLMRLLYVFNIKLNCTHISAATDTPWTPIQAESLADHLRNEYPGFEIECQLMPHNDLIAGLESLADDLQIDILALTTHRRSLFEQLFSPSLAKKMLRYTHKPLLIFHTGK